MVYLAVLKKRTALFFLSCTWPCGHEKCGAIGGSVRVGLCGHLLVDPLGHGGTQTLRGVWCPRSSGNTKDPHKDPATGPCHGPVRLRCCSDAHKRYSLECLISTDPKTPARSGTWTTQQPLPAIRKNSAMGWWQQLS